MRTMLAVVVLVGAGACDSGAPSCKDAVAKAKRYGVDQQLVKVCEARKWSGDLRGCLASATSKETADECLKPVIDDVSAAQAAALQKELDAIDKEVTGAIDFVVNATSDQTRAASLARLESVRGRRAELEKKIALARAEREKGVHVSSECLANPLAAGCS